MLMRRVYHMLLDLSLVDRVGIVIVCPILLGLMGIWQK